MQTRWSSLTGEGAPCMLQGSEDALAGCLFLIHCASVSMAGIRIWACSLRGEGVWQGLECVALCAYPLRMLAYCLRGRHPACAQAACYWKEQRWNGPRPARHTCQGWAESGGQLTVDSKDLIMTKLIREDPSARRKIHTCVTADSGATCEQGEGGPGRDHGGAAQRAQLPLCAQLHRRREPAALQLPVRQAHGLPHA